MLLTSNAVPVALHTWRCIARYGECRNTRTISEKYANSYWCV